jgi:transposase
MALFPPGAGGGQEVDHGYKGKGTLLHLVVDGGGNPLWITTTSAKGDEREQALKLLDQLHAIRIQDTKKMTICEADKGYDADHLRQNMLSRGYLPLIGYRQNRKEKFSTAEVANFFGITRKRWMVERTFAWLKRKCRRLITRWERKVEIWESFAQLGLIFMWLQNLLG